MLRLPWIAKVIRAAHESRIEIKQFDINDVIAAAKSFYDTSFIQGITNPAEVWVKGDPKAAAFQAHLEKKFKDYPGAKPRAVVERKEKDGVTVLSVG